MMKGDTFLRLVSVVLKKVTPPHPPILHPFFYFQ